jgi:hypothetical protein
MITRSTLHPELDGFPPDILSPCRFPGIWIDE